jgi:hypothetical protein
LLSQEDVLTFEVGDRVRAKGVYTIVNISKSFSGRMTAIFDTDRQTSELHYLDDLEHVPAPDDNVVKAIKTAMENIDGSTSISDIDEHHIMVPDRSPENVTTKIIEALDAVGYHITLKQA